MRFGVSSPNMGDAHDLVALAHLAEQTGWDGFFLWDHLHFDRRMALDVHDPWVTLGAIAQSTSRVKLGTAVTPLPRRRPWVVAKHIVTLDHLSKGRAIAGFGLGDPADDEFRAFGDLPQHRGAVLDDGLAVFDGLVRGDRFSHRGPVFTITEAHLRPAPVQRPRPPIWLAAVGTAEAPLRRAARYDGVIPLAGDGALLSPEGLAAVVARVQAMRESDAPFDVVVTAMAERSAADYREAGATWLVASKWPVGDWMGALRERVAAGPPR